LPWLTTIGHPPIMRRWIDSHQSERGNDTDDVCRQARRRTHAAALSALGLVSISRRHRLLRFSTQLPICVNCGCRSQVVYSTHGISI